MKKFIESEKTVMDISDETIIALLEICKQEADPQLIEAVASLIKATQR